MYESRESVDRLVLGDRILLSGRLCIRLPGNLLGGEDVLLKEVLLDELLQVSLEGPTMDDFVPFAVMVGAVLIRPGQ